MQVDINNVTSEQALSILKILIAEDNSLVERIQQLIHQLIGNVDINEVAGDIYDALNCIEVEELWDRSGPSSFGYEAPEDVVIEMFEETLNPFIKQLQQYRASSMFNEEKSYCMGILQGLYRFDKETDSKFGEWAADVAGVMFDNILGEWQQRCQNSEDAAEMIKFIQTNCPDWARN